MLGLDCSTGFSLVVVSGATLWLQWAGFSSRWPLPLQNTSSRAPGLQSLRHVGSVVAAPRRNSCGAGAQLFQVWGLPGSGTEPMPPASAGRFFTPEPPEKPLGTALCGSCPRDRSTGQLPFLSISECAS